MSLLAVRLLRFGQGLSTFISILALNVFVVLLILKLDTAGILATTSWLSVCSPLIVSAVAGLLAAGLNKVEIKSEEFKPLLSRAHYDDARSLAFAAERTTPSSIGRFYEADIFMRLLIGFCLLFLTVVGVFVQYNECKCQSVVKTLIQGVTVLYGVRAVLHFPNLSFTYGRFLQINAAISSYHDVPNAKRLLDLAKWYASAWTGFQACSSFVRAFAIVASVLLAIVSTYQIQNDDCMSECPDLFTQSQHFLFAVYVCEVLSITKRLIFNWYSNSINLKPLLEGAKFYSSYYGSHYNKPAS